VPVLVIGLVRWIFDVPLSAFRPVLSDEIYYWHEALTFARAGLHGGYYTFEEVTNPSGFTPFGLHGPGFVMLYGLAGKVVEWHRHTILVLNLVVIAASAWVWTSTARVSNARLWLSALLFTTFWQMVFWASTGMQESFHHAGAIVMAALFANALASAPRRWVIVTGSAVLCVLAFVRPTWIILMPMWALVTTRHSSRKQVMTAVAVSLVAAGVMLLAFNRSVAPYSRGFSFVEAFSFSGGGDSIAGNLLFNLRRTVTFAEYNELEIIHRLQYWSVLFVTIVLAAILWRRRSDWRSGPLAHVAITTATMLALLVLMLVLYSLTNWAEHRVLSAFLLFGALLLVAAPGRLGLLVVAALIVSNVATAGTFRRVFEARRQEQFVWDRRGVTSFEEALAGRVVYRKDQSRWCNTLLTGQEPPYLIAVPPGIGISVVREPDQMHVPLRSHYLLLEQSTLTEFRQMPRVKPLITMPYGTLYLNLDSGCE
jgi:hypothetical protein